MTEPFGLDLWRGLGWRSSFWELLRFYCSLRGKEQQEFLEELSSGRKSNSRWSHLLNISDDAAELILKYSVYRAERLQRTLGSLRTEAEAKAYCETQAIQWAITKTQSQDHHQSSKTLVATVGAIASRVCESLGETFDIDPTRRCVWCTKDHLHVTARNLDGAIPAVRNPYAVWEIKEYWGKTSGGSKMSDAVYECHLVGREIREFEERAQQEIAHVVLLDGKEQWHSRKSDLARFIDLHNQGLIDHLLVGWDIESQWQSLLIRLVKSNKRR